MIVVAAAVNTRTHTLKPMSHSCRQRDPRIQGCTKTTALAIGGFRRGGFAAKNSCETFIPNKRKTDGARA